MYLGRGRGTKKNTPSSSVPSAYVIVMLVSDSSGSFSTLSVLSFLPNILGTLTKQGENLTPGETSPKRGEIDATKLLEGKSSLLDIFLCCLHLPTLTGIVGVTADVVDITLWLP